MRFGGVCVIFVVFVNFVCFNGSVVFFCVLYGFAVGFVIFFYRVGVVLLVVVSLWCVVGCVFVFVLSCVFVWWIVVALFGPIYDVYIICGFGLGLVGWPSLAVCVPLIWLNLFIIIS